MSLFLTEAKELQPEIVQWRRHLHRIPETRLSLPNTKACLMEELHKMGLTEIREIGESGLTATIFAGEGRSTIAIRADMDALPIREATGLPFASDNGAMHACGHDAHMAMVLGAAKILSRHRQLLKGNVKFIFQPGEEAGDGAKKMIEDGALQEPTVDAIFGIHVCNQLEGITSGKIGVRDGHLMSACDEFFIKISGKATHGATPQSGVDPVPIAAQLITAMQTIVSREVSPQESAVVTIGRICGGDATNVIPDFVELAGTTRTQSEEARQFVAQRIEELVQSIASGMRGTGELIFQYGDPPLSNDKAMTDCAAKAAEKVVGKGDVIYLKDPVMASDDIVYYFQQVPGSYIHIGCGTGLPGEVAPLHNPKFDLDESVLYRGSAVLAQSAADWLEHASR